MHFSRTIEQAFTPTEHPRLKAQLARGALSVRGENRSDIHVTATLHLDTVDQDGQAQLERIDVPMAQQGDEVVVGPAEFDDADDMGMFGLFFGLARRPRVDLDIRVPRHCAVETAHRVGATEIEGIRNSVIAETRTGRMQLTDIEGALKVESRTGQIDVRHTRGPLSVESRTGRVDLRDVQGEVTCTNRTGAIQARDCSGPFHLTSHTGSVTYEGNVRDNGAIEVHTGTIRLAVPGDAAFFLDAASARGSVRSDLVVDEGRREPPRDAPTVRLRAHTGSIRVTQR
jgi:hypothetical protein